MPCAPGSLCSKTLPLVRQSPAASCRLRAATPFVSAGAPQDLSRAAALSSSALLDLGCTCPSGPPSESDGLDGIIFRILWPASLGRLRSNDRFRFKWVWKWYYMLGPNGQSNGCVSFRDYPAFLNAFLKGEVERLVVVQHLAAAP